MKSCILRKQEVAIYLLIIGILALVNMGFDLYGILAPIIAQYSLLALIEMGSMILFVFFYQKKETIITTKKNE